MGVNPYNSLGVGGLGVGVGGGGVVRGGVPEYIR